MSWFGRWSNKLLFVNESLTLLWTSRKLLHTGVMKPDVSTPLTYSERFTIQVCHGRHTCLCMNIYMYVCTYIQMNENIMKTNLTKDIQWGLNYYHGSCFRRFLKHSKRQACLQVGRPTSLIIQKYLGASPANLCFASLYLAGTLNYLPLTILVGNERLNHVQK